MMYFVFGSDKEEFKVNAPITSAEYSGFSINEARDVFHTEIEEMKFNHLYFIIDFQLYETPTGIFKSKKKSTTLDYLTLAEYHYNSVDDYKEIWREDKTVIHMKGFDREFHSNINSLQSFLSYVQDGTPAEYYIEYIENDKKYAKRIASTYDIKNCKPISKTEYYMKKRNWEQVPLPQKKLINIELKKYPEWAHKKPVSGV